MNRNGLRGYRFIFHWRFNPYKTEACFQLPRNMRFLLPQDAGRGGQFDRFSRYQRRVGMKPCVLGGWHSKWSMCEACLEVHTRNMWAMEERECEF